MNRFILILLFLTFCGAAAGSLQKTEEHYLRLGSQIYLLNTQISEMQRAYEQRLQQIEFLKKRDSDKVEDLKNRMAAAKLLSDKLQRKEQQLMMLQDSLAHVRLRLLDLYTGRIDSLQNKNTGGSEAEIALLQRKKFLVSAAAEPVKAEFSGLSRILQSAGADSLNPVFLQDYLKHILGNVERQLQQVRKQQQETGEMLLLEQRAGEFMSDVWDDQQLSWLSEAGRQAENPDPVVASDQQALAQILALQVEDYNRMLQQIEFSGSSKDSAEVNRSADELRRHFSLDEYLRFLQHTEKSLLQLQNRLKKEISTP
ncbi:MAG: hypothetical protein WAN36_08080 [Calditrichia bacterium]